MAQEEDKKKDEGQEAPAKKRGLVSMLIFVAIGAAVGGAGVVVLTPPPEKTDRQNLSVPQWEQVEHEDVMKFVVNPETDRGTVVARIGFRFVYKMDRRREKEVLDAIKTYWNRAYSRCFVVISSQKARVLMTAAGKHDLRQLLATELTLSMFPNGEASIDDILWTEFILQH